MRETVISLLAVFAMGALLPAPVQTGKPTREDPAHEELRALRGQMVEAINKNDIDALLTHLDKDVVVTWMDASVSRGPKGVKEYIEKMTKGPDRKVESHSTDAEVDELTHLYGDTGVATGRSQDRFVLTDGRDFVVNTRWTAALAKKDGKWKVAAFHSSANMFDNPVLYLAVRRTALWTGGVVGLAGLAIGTVVGWLLFRRKRSAL
jgi:uncharacterized protein (TIGR02246 family)